MNQASEHRTTRVLLTTLGVSPAIIPELLGYTNIRELPIYANHPQLQLLISERNDSRIESVQELWILTTEAAMDQLQQQPWISALQQAVTIRVWAPSGVMDVSTRQDIRKLKELTFRMVFHATEQFGAGNAFISLTGGRKTMSADIQEAGMLFGCRAMIHILSSGTPDHNKQLNQHPFPAPLPPALAESLSAVVATGHPPSYDILQNPTQLTAADYPLPQNTAMGNPVCSDESLLTNIEKRLQQNIPKIRTALGDYRALRPRFDGIPEPLTVAPAVCAFEHHAPLLTSFSDTSNSMEQPKQWAFRPMKSWGICKDPDSCRMPAPSVQHAAY